MINLNFIKLVVYLNVFRFYPGGVISPALSDTIGSRLFDLIIIFICLIHIFSLDKIKYPRFFTILFLLFCTTVFFHTGLLLISGTLLSNYTASNRELFELFRYFIIFLVFIAAYNEPRIHRLDFWSNIFLTSFVVYLFIVLVEIFNIPVLKNITNLFYGSSKGRFISFLDLRQGGFFANPNWASLFLVWLYVFFKENPIKKYLMNKSILISIVILIFATGSRTGLACLLGVIGLKNISEISIKKILIFGTFFILIFYIFNFYRMQIMMLIPLRMRDVFNLLSTGSIVEVQSLDARFEMWKNAINNIFIFNPYLGVGPFKAQFGGVFDNQFIKWLVWYGAFGLFYIIAFFISIPSIIVRKKNLYASTELSIFGNCLIYISVALIFSGITGAFFDNTQLIFLFFILLASFLGMEKLKKDEKAIQLT